MKTVASRYLYGSSKKPTVDEAGSRREKGWTFLTTHGLVLMDVLEHPGDTVRQISDRLGFSESAVTKVLGALRSAGYLKAKRVGRQNVHSANLELPKGQLSLSSSRVRDQFDLLVAKYSPAQSESWDLGFREDPSRKRKREKVGRIA